MEKGGHILRRPSPTRPAGGDGQQNGDDEGKDLEPFQLGRIFQEQRQLPSGQVNKRETLYDGAGHKASVSELATVTPSNRTQFLNYDPFGRPGIIRPPDVLLACHLLGILILLACGSARENLPPLDEKAVAEWKKHEAVFVQALRGHQESDKFDNACLFFEQVTGLHLHLNYFTMGVLPTADSDRDLVQIRAWYRLNKHRLYWDERSRTVKVRSRRK